MAMTDDQVKGEAWDKAVYADGTKFIFQKRLERLKKLVRCRDFLSLIVPALIAFTYQTDWIQTYPNLKIFIIAILGLAGLAQTIMSFWSLLSKWDEDQSYYLRAIRDGEEMKGLWSDLAKGIPNNLQQTFEFLKKHQDLIDSHDIQKNITSRENNIGIRYGLINFRRACVCGTIPTSTTLPWRPKKRCAVCGGN